MGKIKDSMFDFICQELAAGKTYLQIKESENKIPAHSTFFDHCARDPLLMKRYQEARRFNAEVRGDQMYKIADKDLDIDDSPQEMQRRKLMVDVRKWHMSKILPRVYGDKLDLNHSGEIDNPVTKIERIIIDKADLSFI